MPFNLTTFDAALQAKLNTANVSLSSQDYLLLTKAVQAALDVSEGVSLLSLKGTANGVAGLDGTGNVPMSQLLNAIPAQGGNTGKYLTTNGTSTSWGTIDVFPSQTSNSGKLLTTNGSSVSWTNTATLASLSTTGDLVSGDQLYVGSGAATFESSGTLTDAMAVFRKIGGANSFAQLAVQNATSTSSTDIIAYMDNGDDSEGWVGMGIAGSAFDDTTYGITAPGDGYIFHNTKTGGSRKGNLVIATGDAGTENKLVFAAGGFASGDTQMEITPGQNIHIEIPTPSTSPTTGALTVVGGVGIQGDMNINGDVAIQGTITFGGGGTTVETSNLAVTDPAVFVGTNNQSDIVDLAFIGEYATTVSPIVATVNNKALTSNVATLTTASAHTYLAGDVVTITGVDATFNGTFNIIAVPTSTTFTYAKTAANVTSAAVSPTGTSTVNARRKFAGIARDASDGIIKAFKDATTKPTSTVNFSEAGLGFADFRVAGLTASSANITSATIGSVTNTEIGYLAGVSSNIQTQISAKAEASSPTITGNATFSASSGIPIKITNTGTGNSFVVEDEASTDASPFVVDATGKVGIGTSSPQSELHIAGNDPTIRLEDNAGSPTKTWSIRSSDGELRFRDVTTGSDRLIITSDGALNAPIITNAQTVTTYALTLSDNGKLVEFNNASPISVSVPTNSSQPFPIGTRIDILQTGNGQVTIGGAVGVVVNGTGNKLRTIWSSATLIKRGTDLWVLIGDIL